MKFILYNFLLFLRPLLFSTAKILGIFLFIGGIVVMYFYRTMEMWILGGVMCVSPFLLFLIRDLYDSLIFRLKPDNVRLFLTKY
jgi:hypothetical protein